MVTLTKRDLALIGAAAGTADFLAEGRLSAPLARALKRYVLPQVARAGPRLAVTGFQVAKQIALRHPVLTAGAIVYYTYKNRKEIGRLVEQGYDVLQDVRSKLPEPGIGAPKIRRVKPPNRFSKAVGKGMRALKSSKFYGKKGVLSNAKTAFKVSTKAASARLQGKKMPKSGPSKIAYKAAKGVYTDEILRRKMK